MTFNAGFGDRSIRINSFEVVEFSSFDRPCIDLTGIIRHHLQSCAFKVRGRPTFLFKGPETRQPV